MNLGRHKFVHTYLGTLVSNGAEAMSQYRLALRAEAGSDGPMNPETARPVKWEAGETLRRELADYENDQQCCRNLTHENPYEWKHLSTYSHCYSAIRVAITSASEAQPFHPAWEYFTTYLVEKLGVDAAAEVTALFVLGGCRVLEKP